VYLTFFLCDMTSSDSSCERPQGQEGEDWNVSIKNSFLHFKGPMIDEDLDDNQNQCARARSLSFSDYMCNEPLKEFTSDFRHRRCRSSPEEPASPHSVDVPLTAMAHRPTAVPLPRSTTEPCSSQQHQDSTMAIKEETLTASSQSTSAESSLAGSPMLNTAEAPSVNFVPLTTEESVLTLPTEGGKGNYCPEIVNIHEEEQKSRRDGNRRARRRRNGKKGGKKGDDGSSPTKFGGVEYAHANVPRTKNLLEVYGAPDSLPSTTIMVRNIPNRYKQKELVMELNQNDMKNAYDFVYLPMDKSTTSNVGYAFVNFISEDYCKKAIEIFDGYRFKKYQSISRKIASVSIAHIQGLANNVKHYKQSAVNESKIKEHRPLVRTYPTKKIA